MKTYGFLSVCAVAATISGAASAASITDEFTSFWVLGDSLSGFVGEVGGETTLRASDGPLWSEQIILDFRAAGKEADSFAELGATAGLERDDRLDLADQVDLLEAETDRFGDTPLVGITIGGNDIGAFAEGLSPFTSQAAFEAGLTDLIDAGVNDFLLFTIPDIGSTPLIRDFTPYEATEDLTAEEVRAAAIAAATGATTALNSLFFDVVLASLPEDVTVNVIDLFTLTQIAYADPGFYGVDAIGPCFLPGVGPIEDCTETSFWDPFHPTGVLHSFVADEVRATYAPIPLPAAGWLLLAGLGGLAALRQRG